MNSRSPLSEPIGIKLSNATRNHGADATPTSRRRLKKRALVLLLSEDDNVRQRATSGHTDSIPHKTCAHCGEDKPAPAFLPTKFAEDRLTAVCRLCTFARAERDRRGREAR